MTIPALDRAPLRVDGLQRDETIASARRAVARSLRDAGIEAPEVDARLLIGYALGLDRTELAAASGRVLSGVEVQRVVVLTERRLRGEPVALIVGEKEFWGLSFRVTPATLIPRPETETVVEAALAAIDEAGPRTRSLRIADLGVGSGAILLALLSELPNAFGVGTDLAIEALAVARQNAQRLMLEDRAAFLRSDFARALRGGFDGVVSNPPNIETPDIAVRAGAVRDHEPRLALDGGTDGLDAYRRIARQSNDLLAPGGHLIVEIGKGQETAVADLFQCAGLALARPPVRDLAGMPRVLILASD